MVQTNKDQGGCCETGKVCCSGLSQYLSPKMFKALGDPSRVRLLIKLAEAGGPCTVSDVAKDGNVDISVVSRHLAILREAGIIECVKEGKEVFCSVKTGQLAGILRDLADAFEQCCPSKEPAPQEKK